MEKSTLNSLVIKYKSDCIRSPIGSSKNVANSMDNKEIDKDASNNFSIKVLVDSIKPKKCQQSLTESFQFDENMLQTLSGISSTFRTMLGDKIKHNKAENFHVDQNYYEIIQKHSKNNPFVDHTFPTNNSSIYFTNEFKLWLQHQRKIVKNEKITWIRARDLYANPQFAIDNKGQPLNISNTDETNYKKYFQTTDLDQGSLGDCWFVSAATGIIQNYKLFKTIVPFDNTFGDNYTGAFHFRFWIYGKWKDVVVDDYLPVGPDNRLIFCKNIEHPNEFWCSLLEKAYAKIHGVYEALDGGFTSDALIDMSGGVDESFDLNKIKKYLYDPKPKLQNPHNGEPFIDIDILWDILYNCRKKGSVIGCNINLKNEDLKGFNKEVKLDNGLVRGHAYVMTKLATINLENNLYRIVRIYNPWGNSIEWNGEWSDRSKIWSNIDDATKQVLELSNENDGEFWMPYDEWLSNFDVCQVCNLSPDTICEITEDEWHNQRLLSNIYSMWQCQIFNGKWIKGENAGGRGHDNPEFYFENPQFTFLLAESDMIKDNHCWVIIALMQKYTRLKRKELNVSSAEEYIQYRLFKIKDLNIYAKHIAEDMTLSMDDLVKIGSSGSYINTREVTKRFSLDPGAYVIIPSIYDENVEGDFLLRIFTEKPLLKNKRLTRKSTLASKSSLSTNNARAVGTVLQFADDFRKRNMGLNNRDSTNLEHKFVERQKSIANHNIECNQM